ncbi:hypothetical protein D3C75_1224810 [compost metagenome]
MLFIGIHDDQPFQDTDLRRGQSNALCIVHGIRHIIQQFLYIGGYLGHRLSGFMQHFIRFFHDQPYSHYKHTILEHFYSIANSELSI